MSVCLFVCFAVLLCFCFLFLFFNEWKYLTGILINWKWAGRWPDPSSGCLRGGRLERWCGFKSTGCSYRASEISFQHPYHSAHSHLQRKLQKSDTLFRPLWVTHTHTHTHTQIKIKQAKRKSEICIWGNKILLSKQVVAHTFNPSTLETEIDRSLWVQGQLGLQNEFQDSQGYTEKLKTKQNKIK